MVEFRSKSRPFVLEIKFKEFEVICMVADSASRRVLTLYECQKDLKNSLHVNEPRQEGRM